MRPRSVAFFVTLSEGTVEVERQPRHEPIHLEVPDSAPETGPHSLAEALICAFICEKHDVA
jgi:hypothetical protein